MQASSLTNSSAHTTDTASVPVIAGMEALVAGRAVTRKPRERRTTATPAKRVKELILVEGARKG